MPLDAPPERPKNEVRSDHFQETVSESRRTDAVPEEDFINDEERRRYLAGLADVRAGRVVSHAELKKELGL